MDDDSDTVQVSDDSGDGSDGGDSLDYGASADDGGFAGDQGDDASSDDTSAYAGDTGYDASGGTGGDGGWGSFDPSAATDSVTSSLGDAASSLWHAAGHVAEGLGDAAMVGGHSIVAGWDAFWGDQAGADQHIAEAHKNEDARDSEFHQAGQDLWGN